ncbi:MAG: DUF4123 domain-containing protein [Pirellulales bacterium]|nr:DUF4123 domain-containing protein [Pirellulales bacterium]
MSAILTVPMTVEHLSQMLAAASESLYAVIDACDEPTVPPRMWSLEGRAVSLYRGTADEELWSIAPYLVQVDGELLAWILECLAERPWGFFAEATVDLHELRQHFRRFLTVEDPEGKRVYFRFYDPRVLPRFLSVCTAEEAARFFGPISRLIVNGGGQWQSIHRAAATARPAQSLSR